ncbi:MAG: MBL fold metallo-hydrolase, partial [Planctomycetota bacterium]
MELTFLGTCSGTEPIEGYRHVSFTLATAGGVYFFDAGGSCAYTAHVMGIDLLAVRAVFISHTHLDHIGGL